MAIEAVHIELVSALTAATCIGGLKKFVVRRSLQNTIFSDNGSNLIGARNEMNALQNLLSAIRITPGFHPGFHLYQAECSSEQPQFVDTKLHLGARYETPAKWTPHMTGHSVHNQAEGR